MPKTKHSKKSAKLQKIAAVGVSALALTSATAPGVQALSLIAHEYPATEVTLQYMGPLKVNQGQMSEKNFYLNAINTAHNRISTYSRSRPTSEENGMLRVQGVGSDPSRERRLDLELIFQPAGLDVVSTEGTYIFSTLYNKMTERNDYKEFDIDTMGQDLYDNAEPVLYLSPTWEAGDWAKIDYGRCTNAESFKKKAEAVRNGTSTEYVTCMIENRPDGQGIQYTPKLYGEALKVTPAEEEANDERFWQKYHIDYSLIEISDPAQREALQGLEKELWHQDAEILELERRIANAENGFSQEDVAALRAEQAELIDYQAEYFAHVDVVRSYFLSAQDDAAQLAQAQEQLRWLEEELNMSYQQIWELEDAVAQGDLQITELEREVTELEAQLAAAEAELASSGQASAEQLAEIEELRNSLDSKNDLIEGYRVTLAAQVDELERQSELLSAQATELEQLRAELERANQAQPDADAGSADDDAVSVPVAPTPDAGAGAMALPEVVYLGTENSTTPEEISSDLSASLQEINERLSQVEAEALNRGVTSTDATDSEVNKAIEVPALGGDSRLPWWFWLGSGVVITGLGFEVYLYARRRQRKAQQSMQA